MKRNLLKILREWKQEERHKPIVLKGARQVGKSYLAKELGSDFDTFAEVNFDFQPELKRVFDRDLDPARITLELSLALKTRIEAGRTLLFLDEIQDCPKAIRALRYFYEKMPGLHVIAAGSLLDFVLEHTGVPVGRVTPLHLYPMSFIEFLDAMGEDTLKEVLLGHDVKAPLAEVAHRRLNRLLSEYLATGGMPEAVAEWIRDKDVHRVVSIQRSLIETYRQDFAKYASGKKIRHVDVVYSGVAGTMGKKLVFAALGSHYRTRELKPALELLVKAQVVHTVRHSSCGGAPLAAQANPDFFKVILCDVGLAQTMLSLDTARWIVDGDANLLLAGPVVESFIGQELLAYSIPFERAQLHYWAREKRGASAELDYIIERGEAPLPIEVKSGRSNHFKSLRIFLREKPHVSDAVVFSRGNFGRIGAIRHYPLYATALLTRE